MKEKLKRTITWIIPSGEVPDGTLLIEVDLSSGESDVALVYIDDEDNNTLVYADDSQDVYTPWLWENVSRYVPLAEILLVER